MILVRLPDGSQYQYEAPLTVAQMASSIGTGLVNKVPLAGRIDGKLVDTSYLINRDVSLTIVTDQDADGLNIIRHSTAHLLAYAVKDLFPEAQVAIGPVIDNGFYYDFSYHRAFTLEDLEALEKKMHELAKKDEPITREVRSREDAIRLFMSIGEKYKAQIIESIPAMEEISLYRTGKFVDLCRGPHVPSTGKLKVFKLMKVAGAYWRGDAKKEQLQRIYGTAWMKKENQDAYLRMLTEAEKYDHRKLGRALDFFHIQEETPGFIFWHPKGWMLWQEVEQYMRRVYLNNGYQEVKGPQILDRSLWEKSGHWENYKDNMFTTESENRAYALKPMSCPGHVLIFNSALHSYRDLPLRYGEFGQCHRNEPSGGLHGLMRVRGFTQDDGHIFCTENQIIDECVNYTTLLQAVYKDFGFTDVIYKVATRPEHRIGINENSNKAEFALMESLRRLGCEFEIAEGDGAFYGPKIEYTLKDALGRQWQCGTMQVDFSMPERLDVEYVAEDNSRKRPVMLHRAILGSLERFIGILIEHHAGALPVWLSPEQVIVINVSERTASYTQKVTKKLKEQGFRVSSDLRNEKISYKIRQHSLQKVPYLVVVGDKEQEANTVAVRSRSGVDLGMMPVDALIKRLAQDCASFQ